MKVPIVALNTKVYEIRVCITRVCYRLSACRTSGAPVLSSYIDSTSALGALQVHRELQTVLLYVFGISLVYALGISKSLAIKQILYFATHLKSLRRQRAHLLLRSKTKATLIVQNLNFERKKTVNSMIILCPTSVVINAYVFFAY